MQLLGRFAIAFRNSFCSNLVHVDHVSRRSPATNFLLTRCIKSSKRAAIFGGHGGSVAMEVVVAWNDARQKSLSDVVFQESGMRCLISSASVWCNVHDTVEDVFQRLGSMWEGKRSLSSSIITANVYHHYAKFTYINRNQIVAVDVVHPKHEVVTLRLDMKLWRVKEIMNERRSLLEREARKTRNVFEEYSEVIWRGGSCGDDFKPIRIEGTQENRLWMN